MTQIIILILIWGIGLSVGKTGIFHDFLTFSDLFLYLLLFIVGIQLACTNDFKKIHKTFTIKSILITLGLVIGSFGIAPLVGFVLGYGMSKSLLFVSGLGYYSYAGSAISNFASPDVALIAFLVSLFREQFGIIFGRLICSKIDPESFLAITATSSDGLLPFIKAYAGQKYVVSGLTISTILNIMVPIFISMLALWN